MLGYPTCCVKRHELVQGDYRRAFATAIVAAVGKDPRAVECALREDLKVEIAGEDPEDRENMVRTDELFPFVFHAACDTCLSSDQSPTAELNRNYEQLAQQYDRTFHHGFRQMRGINAQIEKLINEAESQGFGPGELKGQLRALLNSLFADRDRIYSRFFLADDEDLP